MLRWNKSKKIISLTKTSRHFHIKNFVLSSHNVKMSLVLKLLDWIKHFFIFHKFFFTFSKFQNELNSPTFVLETISLAKRRL